MPAIDAVVFDLDDTLYPERQFAFSGFAAVAAAFQDRLGPPDECAAAMRRLFDTPNRSRVFNALLAERFGTANDALVARMIETYRNHCPALSLYPDADAALERLASRFTLGLLTDGPLVTQRNKVQALGLTGRFRAVLFTEELGPGFGKPHSIGFERIAAELGAKHHRCAYVADNPAKDFVAPNRLGWKSIRVLRPDGVYAKTPAASHGEPQATIPNLNELDELLRD